VRLCSLKIEQYKYNTLVNFFDLILDKQVLVFRFYKNLTNRNDLKR